MQRRRLSGLLLAVVGLASVVGLAGAESAAAPAPPPDEGAAGRPPVSEAEARALVDAWLRAQNGGDFAAYRQLYATRFDGIKRVGPRVRRFTRDGWLADRERMFARPIKGPPNGPPNVPPMSVTIADTTVQAGPGTARVRFVQTFTRGTFTDRGPKELLLAREAEGLRIAREEMLASETIKPAAAAAAAPPGAFLFVIAQGVVLPRGSTDRAAARGPLELLASASVYVVRSAVDDARLDESTRRWKGRRVRLFSKDGAACVAKIEKLSLIVRVDPHTITRQEWTGAIDANGNARKKPRPYPNARIAREAWAMDEPLVVGELGELGEPGSGCDTAGAADHERWARDAELPAPALATIGNKVSAQVRAEAEKQARRHPSLLEAVTNADGSGGGKHAAPPAIAIEIVSRQGATPLIVGRFESGDTCADWVGLTFIWKLGGDVRHPKLELLNDPSFGLFLLTAAFDLDGDGQLELFGRHGGIGPELTQLRRPPNSYGQYDSLEVKSFECYC